MLASGTQPFEGEEHRPFFWQGGDTVAVLVHGFPGTPREMRPVAELLHDRGWSVRGVLLPGFGSEFDTILERSHHDWLEKVGNEIHTLRQQYRRVMLVGFSMGGAISINVATRYPVDGLVLFAPFVEVNHILWKALPMIRFVLPKVKIFKLFKPDFSDPQTRAGILNFLPDADLDDPETQEQIMNFELPVTMFDEIRTVGKKSSRAAERISQPTLVFQGVQDELVQPAKTRMLIQRFSGAVAYTEVNAPHEIINPDLPAWVTIMAKLTHYAEAVSS